MKLDPRRSYPAKVVGGILVVGIVIVVVGGGLYVHTSSVLQDHQRDRLAGSTDVQDDTFDQILVAKIGRASGLASSAAQLRQLTGSEDQFETRLERLLNRSADESFVKTVHYVNETGRIRVTPVAAADGETLSSAGLTASLGAEPTVRLAPEANAWVVTVPSGTRHYVTMVLNATAIAEEVDGVVGSTTTRIVNSQGVVVLSPNPEEIGTQYVEGSGVDSPAVRTALEDNEGAMTVSAEKTAAARQRVVGYDKIDPTDWAIVSSTPPSELYAFATTIGGNILWTLIAGVVAIGGFGLVVERPTLTAITALSDTARQVSNGDHDTDIETDRRDEIGELYTSIETMRDSLRDRLAEAEEAQEAAKSAREDALEAQQAAEEQSERLRTEATRFATTMERIADGDLTCRFETQSDEEVFTTIEHQFNQMVDEIATTVRRTQDFVTSVANASDGVARDAEEIRDASNEISSAIASISTDADQQADDLEVISREMSDLSTTIEEIASSTDEVATTSQRAATRGREGTEYAERGLEEMTAIQSQTDELVDEITSLEAEVQEIGEIVELITDIADQTNMLALNASVEAARAGGGTDSEVEGDGFGVVADEIKSLAGEASEAAQEIEARITSIQDSTEDTVADIERARERVADGAETVEQALEALSDIVTAVEEADSELQEINRATDTQAESSQEVVTMVDDVTGVADKTATEADTAATAASQQEAAVSAVTETLETLSSDTRALQSLVDEFDV